MSRGNLWDTVRHGKLSHRQYCTCNNIVQVHVLVEFCRCYPNVRCQSKQTVYQNVQKYQITGTSHNLNTERSSWPRSARNAQNINAVRQALELGQNNNQRISPRRNGLRVSQSTLNRITRLDLQYHPYQMIRRYELVGTCRPVPKTSHGIF